MKKYDQMIARIRNFQTWYLLAEIARKLQLICLDNHFLTDQLGTPRQTEVYLHFQQTKSKHSTMTYLYLCGLPTNEKSTTNKDKGYLLVLITTRLRHRDSLQRTSSKITIIIHLGT